MKLFGCWEPDVTVSRVRWSVGHRESLAGPLLIRHLDFSAHSNYTELVLIELGETGVFPHVGRRTMVQLPGARRQVYPLVTGTFGGVDFLHSVIGELSDKTSQSELQELEDTMRHSQADQDSNSVLRDLLSQLPAGLIGGENHSAKMDELQQNAQAAQIQNMQITPRQPEAWARQLQDVSKQIYPILEWHDEIMQSITETIEKIPVLPDLVEKFQEQINLFVFSLLAPFVVPVIGQVKTELSTGSSEIIQSSRAKQLIVFRDDQSSDPTHSMLSKDHFRYRDPITMNPCQSPSSPFGPKGWRIDVS